MKGRLPYFGKFSKKKKPSTKNSWAAAAAVGLQNKGRSDFKRRSQLMRMRLKGLQLMPTPLTRPKPWVYIQRTHKCPG